jgi:hypothetical protein
MQFMGSKNRATGYAAANLLTAMFAMRSVFSTVVLLLTIGVSANLHADVCDDIDDLKTGWDAMSIDVAASALPDARLSRREQRELEDGLEKLVLATAIVGEAMKTGNRSERRLGQEIMGYITEMSRFSDRESPAHINDVVGDLSDALEETVDYCDRQ